MGIKPIFAWYDLWVGIFWDAERCRLYVFPVPCLGILFQMGAGQMSAPWLGDRAAKSPSLLSALLAAATLIVCVLFTFAITLGPWIAGIYTIFLRVTK